MRTTTKEQVREAFNSLPPLTYISVIYGKGKNRTYRGFDLQKRREDAIGRLIMFLSEKSLTHNLTSIGYMKGWMNCPERIEVRLTESKEAILNSNIDADMLQAIMDCVNDIDERAKNWNWDEGIDDEADEPYIPSSINEQSEFDPFHIDIGMP